MAHRRGGSEVQRGRSAIKRDAAADARHRHAIDDARDAAGAKAAERRRALVVLGLAAGEGGRAELRVAKGRGNGDEAIVLVVVIGDAQR